MNGRTLLWATLFVAGGILVLGAWVPGASGWSLGPRLGLGTFLLVTGFVFLAGSFAGAIRRRTDRVDGKGGCPVGATCSCGHFNFKPRKACRQCGQATVYPA